METVKLNNGIEMPILGYGVYQVTPEECERCVLVIITVLTVRWKRLIRQVRHVLFYPDRLVDLAECCEIKPAVNQVETHVFNQQIEPQRIMEEYGTRVMSWGPFAEGKNNFFTNELLKTIGEKYGKSVAQVALRYLIQRDVIVIPKSTHKERMIENMDVFDFSLSEEDMQAIVMLDQKKSLFLSHNDPEMVKWLINLVKK